MSRPPIQRASPSPRGIDAETYQRRYFKPRFADLVALTEALARDPEGGVEIADKDRGLARTLIEIPALFAHILGEHQSHYAAEAFLGTAQRDASLVAHSRRLAYTPDHGVAATGLAVFTVKKALSGELPQHFALQSEPKGAVKSQDYETLEAVHVEAAWNTIRPAAALVPTPLVFTDDRITLPLTAPHGLDVGDIVLLEGQGKHAVCEVADANPTDTIVLRRLSQGAESIGAWPAYSAAAPYRILAHPEVGVRSFGWNADPLAFPPGNLRLPGLYTAPTAVGGPDYGYTVAGLSSGGYVPGDSLLLAEAVAPPAISASVAVVRSDSARPYTLAQAREAAVSFRAGEGVAVPQPDPMPDGFQLIEQAVSGRVTLLDLRLMDGSAATWTALPLDATVYMSWSKQIAIAASVPNTAAMASTLTLEADLTAMRPGRKLLLERESDGYTAAATVTKLSAPMAAGGDWDVVLGLEGAAVASDFALGDVVIYGNTAPISHGETKTGDIGTSDGVAPHQSFALKKAPVTRLPGADGAEIELQVRVNGVLWDLVEDFHQVPPEGRVARVLLDADQTVAIAFGGENRGAVPPAGRRNISAEYRVGLGRVGNAGAGRLTRIRKASPILESVTNLLPLAGGTDPASSDDMRRQASRPILTFDRAVSVQDHADLALLYPGVARTAARWLNRGAIELIVADAAGEPPADPATLRTYLDTRRDEQVPLVLLTPQAVDIGLSLRVERDRAWLADSVRLAVTEALIGEDSAAPGLFNFAGREFSAPQSLSGLYRLLLALPGVAGVEAKRFAILPGTGVADILHATDRQWLRLMPTDLVIVVAEPGNLIPDIEEVGA